MTTINIYCDESCHLEHDHQRVMVLGAVCCPKDKARETAEAIRAIKTRHGLSRDFEIKWQKVSPAKVAFYEELVEYFFATQYLSFRALIIPNKGLLRHEKYSNDHDEWYYKMYFTMLKILLSSQDQYRIFLDIKDTRGAKKVRKLREVLCNSLYDFDRDIIQFIQLVKSDEVEQVQLADLLIGVISYLNRGLDTNSAKLRLVDLMRSESKLTLERSTLPGARKVNIFRWQARDVSSNE